MSLRPSVDVIFLAHGRPEFTAVSLLNLLKQTNWSLVSHFYVYTDGDTFTPQSDLLPMLHTIAEHYGGPVAILNHALSLPGAEYVAKIDNDTMVPPDWLEACLDTLVDYCADLLGIEAWTPDQTLFPAECPILTSSSSGPPGARYVPHIGGIGLFRREAFTTYPAPNGRFGLTEWQWQHPQLRKAFLSPPLPVFLLDHLPFEPWTTLNHRYTTTGIQRRQWGDYPEHCKSLWEWWTGEREESMIEEARRMV